MVLVNNSLTKRKNLIFIRKIHQIQKLNILYKTIIQIIIHNNYI
jgi:hypothetical protein